MILLNLPINGKGRVINKFILKNSSILNEQQCSLYLALRFIHWNLINNTVMALKHIDIAN